MFSIHPKIFYSYTGNRHKNIFVRNKCSKFLKMSLLKSSNCRKRGMGYAKVIHKKRERKEKEKVLKING
jgi:hypothetical protein